MASLQVRNQRAQDPRKAALAIALGSVIPSPPLVIGRLTCLGTMEAGSSMGYRWVKMGFAAVACGPRRGSGGTGLAGRGFARPRAPGQPPPPSSISLLPVLLQPLRPPPFSSCIFLKSSPETFQGKVQAERAREKPRQSPGKAGSHSNRRGGFGRAGSSVKTQ